MSDAFAHAIMKRVGGIVESMGQPRWATVQSVDPSRPAVRVLLQPDGVLTGWLPVLQQAAGGGWSVVTVPTVGQQCLVLPDMGDAENGIVVGFAQSDTSRIAEVPEAAGTGGVVNPTATPVAAGETLMTGPGGQVIRIGPAGIYMRGAVTIDGDLRVNGQVQDRHGTLDGLRTNYNTHRHTGVEIGLSTSGTTTEVDP